MRLHDMMLAVVDEYLATIALVERYPHELADVGGMLAFLVKDLNARVNRIAQSDPDFPQADSGFAEMEGWPVVVDAVAVPTRKERPNRQLKSSWQQAKELVDRLGVGTRGAPLIRATPGKLSGDLRTWLFAEFQHWKYWEILEFIQMNLKEAHRTFAKAFQKSGRCDVFPKPPYQFPDWTVEKCTERFLRSELGEVHARKIGESTARDEVQDCLKRWLPKLRVMDNENHLSWSEFTGLLISSAEFDRLLQRPPQSKRPTDS